MRVERNWIARLMGAPTMWALTWIASQSSWRFWSDFLRMFSSIVCSLQRVKTGAVSSALFLRTSTNTALHHHPASQAAVSGASRARVGVARSDDACVRQELPPGVQKWA